MGSISLQVKLVVADVPRGYRRFEIDLQPSGTPQVYEHSQASNDGTRRLTMQFLVQPIIVQGKQFELIEGGFDALHEQE